MQMKVFKKYDEELSQEDIERDFRACAKHIGPIRWLETTMCTDVDAAMSYISSYRIAKGTTAPVAIKFMASSESETLDSLKNAATAAMSEYAEAYAKIRPKASCGFVYCKTCGSMISRVLMQSNFCPVCGTDFRTVTDLDEIERLRCKKVEAQNAYEKEKKAIVSGETGCDFKVMWLVSA